MLFTLSAPACSALVDTETIGVCNQSFGLSMGEFMGQLVVHRSVLLTINLIGYFFGVCF